VKVREKKEKKKSGEEVGRMASGERRWGRKGREGRWENEVIGGGDKQ